MAVTYKGITEDVDDSTRTSITMQIPSEAVEDDLLICYISKDDDVAIYTDGDYSNWNMLVNAGAGTGNALYVAWRKATSADVSGAVSWTWNGDSEDYYGCILCYGGADTTTPVPASDYTAQGTADAIPIAPSVAFTDLAAGSMVFQCFGADDNDEPYTVPSELTSRFNNSITDTGGAGGDRSTFIDWITPTGGSGADWSYPEDIYDDNTTSSATSNLTANIWSTYIECTHSAISCFKVRYYLDNTDEISIDVYYSDAWHNIYEGNVTEEYKWAEIAIGSTQTVTKARFKFRNSSDTQVHFRETDFGHSASVEGSGNTGTATFGMNAAEQWVAATLVIEAASVAGQALLSTAAIATSITGALSRGASEALTSASNLVTSTTSKLTRLMKLISTSTIATSITSILTKGIALLSTSNVATSITGSLSRGVSEALTSVSNITTSIAGVLSRGITKILISAPAIATSTSGVISRGVTGVLTSTSNIVTSITGVLSRGVTEGLNSTSNIVTSITATLTKQAGETLALLSTAVMSTSITGILSRGVTETLISASALTTSMVASLSRGIKETLISTANITTSIIAELSKTGAMMLTSVANIATSITARLRLGVTHTFYTSESDSYIYKYSNVNYITAQEATTGSGVVAYQLVGQDFGNSYWWVFRDFLYFDTSNIPSGAVITKVILGLYCLTDDSIEDFDIVVSNGMPTYPHDPTVLGDYDISHYSGDGGSKNTSEVLEEAWFEIILNATGRGWVQKGSGAKTKFCLLSSRDIAQIAPTDDESVEFNSYEDNINYRPKLIVYYTYPKIVLLSVSDLTTSFMAKLKMIVILLNSTASLATSITSSLSRGVTQTLISLTNITSSFTSRLTRIRDLISTSAIAVSITSMLSRGVTEILTSTSALTTSMVAALSRGVKETLTSTANIATSIIAQLSKIGAIILSSVANIVCTINNVTLGRGVTEALTSISAVTTSITGILSRGIKQILTSTSNVAISILGSLSRGVTEILISTVNMVTSITGSLSRGITQVLTSTSNIVTSITAVLHLLAKELNSVANMVTSITSSLSRGAAEALTSTTNMSTSITASLTRGIKQTLISAINIGTSFVSSLSRGTKEILTSVSNIVVSILSKLKSDLMWTEEIKKTSTYIEEDKKIATYVEEDKKTATYVEEDKR